MKVQVRWLCAVAAVSAAVVGMQAFPQPAFAQSMVTLPTPTSAPPGTVLTDVVTGVVTDANVAAGPDHVVAVVNFGMQIWDKATRMSLTSPPLALTTFMGTTPDTCFDPRVIYVAPEDRWIVSCAWGTVGDPAGSVAVAVSATSDPTGTWETFTDTVPITLDAPSIVATTDKFAIYGGGGDGPGTNSLYAYPLDDVLSATSGSFPAATASDDTLPAFPPRGAAPHQGSGTNETDAYFVAASSTTTTAWVVSGPPASPTFTFITLATHSTPAPPDPLPVPGGGSITVGGVFGRHVMATRTDGHTVIASSGGIECPGSPSNACAYVDVHNLTDDTYDRTVVAGPSGTNIAHAAPGIDTDGNVVISYTYSSPTIMPAAAVASIQSTGGYHVVTAPGNPSATTVPGMRYGDYYSVAQDPSDGSRLWFTAQYQNDSSSTTDDFGAAVACATATEFGCLDDPPTDGPKAQYKNNDAAPGDNQIKPGLQVVNNTTGSVDLADVTIRYWFTRDGGASTFSSNCDFAVVNCTNLTHTVVNLATPVTGADSYLEVGFTSGAGSLPPSADTGEMQLRLNKTDWSAFTETGDYSYDTGTTFADTTTVTVYLNGQLVWGTEP